MSPARVKARPVRYSTTWSKSMAELGKYMRDLGFDVWEIECRAALAGSPESVNLPKDVKRVTLTYADEGRRVQLSVDSQNRAMDNLRVIVLAMEARRLNIVRGVEDLVRQSYMALLGGPAQVDPYEVLGIRPDADLELAEAAYKAKARRAHPDHGGTPEAMEQLNRAIAELRERLAEPSREAVPA